MKKQISKILTGVILILLSSNHTKADFSPAFSISGTSFCLEPSGIYYNPMYVTLQYLNPVPDTVTITYDNDFYGVQFYSRINNANLPKNEEVLQINQPGIYTVSITFTGNNSHVSRTYGQVISVFGINPAIGLDYPNEFGDNAFCKSQTITGTPLVSVAGGFFLANKASYHQDYYPQKTYGNVDNVPILNPVTGNIDINTVLPGEYQVAYFVTSLNGCALTTVTVNTLPSVVVDYGTYPICNDNESQHMIFPSNQDFYQYPGYFTFSNSGFYSLPMIGAIGIHPTLSGLYTIYYHATVKGCPTISGFDVITIAGQPVVPQLSLITSIVCDTTKNFNVINNSKLTGGYYILANHVYAQKIISENGTWLLPYTKDIFDNWAWQKYYIQYVVTTPGCNQYLSLPVLVTLSGCVLKDSDTLFMNRNGLIVQNEAIIVWNRVVSVSSYCLELSKAPDFSKAGDVLYFCGMDSTYFKIGPEIFKNARIESGSKYYWRVATQDANGSITGWSPTTWFVYGRLEGIENSPAVVGLQVYPNPTPGDFIIQLPTEGTPDVQLIDVLGQRVTIQMEKKSTSDYRIQLGNIPNGIYSLKIQLKNSVFVRSVIKE